MEKKRIWAFLAFRCRPDKLLRIMKLTVVLIFIFVLGVNANGISQQKINMKLGTVTYEQLFAELQKQTGHYVLYNNKRLNKDTQLNADFTNMTIDQILTEVLKEKDISYEIKDEFIVLYPLEENPVQIEAEAIKIKGKVTDKNGESLPGTTVMVKGSLKGTTTDTNGNYTIEAPNNAILVFTFIGYTKQEISVSGKTDINVVLEEEIAELEQVVITGMFTRKAESFTGAATTFKGEDLKAVGTKNILQSIAILDPSFHITENLEFGSDPNRMPEVQIRGQASVPDLKGEYATNPNQPLYILNGFESTAQKIFDLDMNLVESVTLLKDGVSKAIYGSKAANGVVVVETKRPQKGKLRFSYKGNLDLTAPDLTSYNMTNSMEKLQAEVLAHRYESPNPKYQTELTETYASLYAEALRGVDTYWLSQPLQVGVGQKHSLYMDGGNDAMTYSVNIYYNDIKGVMKGSSRKTISGNFNLAYRFKNLSFKNNLSIDRNKGTNSPYGSFSEYSRMNPYWRIADENGELIKQYANNAYNPLYNASLNTKDYSQYTSITENFYVEWAIRDNLKLTSQISLGVQFDKSELFYPASHTNFINIDPASEYYSSRGEYTLTNGQSTNLNGNVGISYSLYRSKHMLTANAFYSFGQSVNESTGMVVTGFPNDKMDYITFGNQYLDGSKPSGSESTSREIGVTTAVNYSYDNRYLVDFSYRANASSQFGAANRWGGFWSAGIGWNIHKESFLKNVEFIDQLKIRATTGITGSQNFNSYQSIATYSYITDKNYDGDLGEYLLGLPNKNLKWQQTQDNNLGVDIGLFNKMNFSFEYYMKKTNDLLTDITLPPSSGFSTYKENLGKTKNTGFQVSANYKVYSNLKNNSYANIYFSIASNTNKITDISNALRKLNEEQDAVKDEYDPTAEGNASKRKPSVRFEEGQSMTAIWAVPSMGIDPANGKEIFLKKDGTLTYEWSSDDQIVAGDSRPQYNGSIGTSLQVKNFSLNMAFTFNFGGQVYNSTLVDKVENADLTWNVDKRVLNDRWNTPGQESLYKDIADTNPTKPTTRFVQDLNELVFSSLNLSYDFSKFAFVKSMKLESLRLSFNMNDIARISSVKVERGTAYPFSRVFSFALQATF